MIPPRPSNQFENFQLLEWLDQIQRYTDDNVYTPTITGVANVDSTTAFSCQYLRVGKTVTVSGRVDVDATAAGGTLTTIRISIPVASNFANTNECGGAASSADGNSGPISANVANDAAEFNYSSASAANVVFLFTFTYRVI